MDADIAEHFATQIFGAAPSQASLKLLPQTTGLSVPELKPGEFFLLSPTRRVRFHPR
jgi:hypothetical protein